jgi:hypothetical protein
MLVIHRMSLPFSLPASRAGVLLCLGRQLRRPALLNPRAAPCQANFAQMLSESCTGLVRERPAAGGSRRTVRGPPARLDFTQTILHSIERFNRLF